MSEQAKAIGGIKATFWESSQHCAVPWLPGRELRRFVTGLYVDPARDFVGVYFSTNGYIPPYGEDRAQGFLRQAAKYLNGE